MTVSTIAETIALLASTFAEAMALAGRIGEQLEDWAAEETRFTFADGSALVFSDAGFYAEEPTEELKPTLNPTTPTRDPSPC